MNYLAHFHLAGDTEGFILGALLGDFVKGPLDESVLTTNGKTGFFPPTTLAGIQLHRRIDGFFDREFCHHEIVELQTPRYRRYLPIVLDLFFDFALAREWHTLEAATIDTFNRQVIGAIRPYHSALPKGAQFFFNRLEEFDLLLNYGEKIFLRRTAEHISQKLPAGNGLLATFDEVMQNEEEFTGHFRACYPRLQAFAREQRVLLSGNLQES